MSLPDTYKGLLGCRTEPMDIKLTELFMKLFMAEMDPAFEAAVMKEKEAGRLPDGAKILLGRLNWYGIRPNMALTLLITGICDSPGKVITWAFTLAMIAKKYNVPVLKISLLTNCFPDGFPVASEYERIWQEQKIGGGNQLDDGGNWPDFNWYDVWEDITVQEFATILRRDHRVVIEVLMQMGIVADPAFKMKTDHINQFRDLWKKKIQINPKKDKAA